MRATAPPVHAGEDDGCGFIVDERACAEPRRQGSPYCARHHALCYLPHGSDAEARRLRAVETIAAAIGGRRAGAGSPGTPPARFLARLERLVRNLS